MGRSSEKLLEISFCDISWFSPGSAQNDQGGMRDWLKDDADILGYQNSTVL
jgi:hypothetical protein